MKSFVAVALLTCAAGLQGLGCSGLVHGYTQASYEGQVLRCDSEGGARRLEIEMNYDATIRNWVNQSKPDYLLVKSGSEVELFYIGDGRTVLFKRGFMPESAISVEEGIRKDVAVFFSREDQNRLASRPAAEERSASGEEL